LRFLRLTQEIRLAWECANLRGIVGGNTHEVEADIERWLYQSGLTEVSVGVLRPELPRWAEFLRQRGVSRIPPMPSRDPHDWHATNLLCLLVKQAMDERDSSQEHALRNLARVRPIKP